MTHTNRQTYNVNVSTISERVLHFFFAVDDGYDDCYDDGVDDNNDDEVISISMSRIHLVI